MDYQEIEELLGDQVKEFAEFKKANDERLKNLERNLSVFARKAGQREAQASTPE